MERLDKFLSSRSGISRREAQKSIKSGEVTVNSAVCRTTDFKVNPDTDAVLLRGQAVCADEHIYIMLNKPAGVVSATEDRSERTVLDILPPDGFSFEVKCLRLQNEEGEDVPSAPHPMQRLYLTADRFIPKGSVIRKKNG